jgi:serine protease Do
MKRLVAAGLTLVAGLAAQAPAEPPEEVNLRRTVTVEVVRKTKDAVVNISTTKSVPRRVGGFGGNDPFWFPFDDGQIVQVPANSLGSGFLLHPDGYVVTNHHVIDRARQINVELADGRKLRAELISSDVESDLAILKVTDKDGKLFPAMELGDSADLMIGEPVIAVGNPLGFSHSVSTGIVSAVHRNLKDGRDRVLLSDLVQTDAAINPGNSGGPLLNAYGQVIGINTAIRGDAQNIGFAVPVNKLRDLIPDLMRPAAVTKVDVQLKLTERRRTTEPAGVQCEVVATRPDGRTAVLKSVGGRACGNIVDAYAALLKANAGEALELEWEGGRRESLTPKPTPLPDAVVQARKRLGIGIQALTPLLAERFKLSVEEGLLVTEVVQGGVAEKAGLEPGDVVVQLGRYRVRRLEEFGALIEHLPEHGRVRVGVMRGEQVGFATLEF